MQPMLGAIPDRAVKCPACRSSSAIGARAKSPEKNPGTSSTGTRLGSGSVAGRWCGSSRPATLKMERFSRTAVITGG